MSPVSLRGQPIAFGMALLIATLAATLALPALYHLGQEWWTLPAYGHGPILVALAGWMLWQRRSLLRVSNRRSAAWSVPLMFVSMLLLVAAGHGAIHVFAQYALIGVAAAIGIALYGLRFVRIAAVPLLLLFLAIPLPGVIETLLTSDLKRTSTALAGELLRLLQVPVYVEGNMVDLGTYQLQVADACAGLNYLFPLLSLAVVVAAHLSTPPWKKLLIVACAVPVTVAMNTLRIAVTGLFVRHFGAAAAEGFVHAFEGWILFLAALALLLPLAAVIVRLGATGRSLSAALRAGMEPAPVPESEAPVAVRPVAASLVLVLCAAIGAAALSGRPSLEPVRVPLAEFPVQVDAWRGRPLAAPLDAIRGLQLSEFLMAEYAQHNDPAPVEFYIAYYGSQADGRTPHSPSDCLPGSGWEILAFQRADLVLHGTTRVPVNRAVMQSGHDRMLVYYFYRQGSRWLSREYLAKLYLFLDSVRDGRSDGALVRLTVPVVTSEADAEASLQNFLTAAWTPMQRHFGD